MRAGKLRHRVEVQARGDTQKPSGGYADPWVTLDTVYASIEQISAREREAAQAMMPEATHKISVRYTSIWADPITAAKYRIAFRGRIFNIAPPNNVDERNIEVWMYATEGTTRG